MKTLLLLLLLASVPAHADTRDDLKKIDASLRACSAEETACVTAALKSADAVLGRVYRAELAKLKQQPDDENSEVLKRLEASQLVWTAFREANSSLHGIRNLDGIGMENLSHRLELTKDRVLELDELFNSEG